MITEEMEDILIERILQRQIKANEKILKEIGKVLGEIGELSPSNAYTIKQQIKYGESLDKIVKILSETSKINQKEIYKMLENDAIINLNKTKKYFKAKNLDFIPYEENIPLKQKVMEVASATLKEYSNISRTAGLRFLNSKGKVVSKGIKEAYKEIIDDAILNVSTGKQSFYEALKDQLETIGSYGVRSLQYEEGYSRRIESAMRMNIQDGLNRLSIAQQELVGNQFDSDGWEVTVHANPAPDHERVQGHIFSNKEFAKLQEFDYFGVIKDIDGNVYMRDGFAKIRPIGQLNCYHRANAIVIGVDKPLYTEEQLKKIREENNKKIEYNGREYTKYEATQIQRRLETELRRTREEKITLKAGNQSGNLNDKISKLTKRERHLLEEYHKLSKIGGLAEKLERTRVLTNR